MNKDSKIETAQEVPVQEQPKELTWKDLESHTWNDLQSHNFKYLDITSK